MLKCQFHTHVKGDTCDNVKHTAKELIKKAAALSYDVLAITTHNKIIFNKQLRKYAEKKGILLMPGTEFEIDKKHILCLNAHSDILKVKNFKDLKNYRKKHPESLIIAPHPFFPGKVTLKKSLIDNIDLFDAIEISFCYTKQKNFNKKAIALAKRWKKPLIATSDCHVLDYLDISYCFINSKKDISSIFKAIKQNRIKNHTKPLSWWKIGTILLRMFLVGKAVKKK